MVLPNGVSILKEGRLQFVTQRGYFAPPYVSCMFAALSSVLIWMGYELPLARNEDDTPPENFVWTLHKASGASLTSGSGIRHTKNALNKLLPDAPVFYGAASPDEVIGLLEKGAGIRVTAKCSKLPQYLKRWVGSYTGGHAFAIIGTRVSEGKRQVFWLDPMGRPSVYSGIWINWDDVKDILDRTTAGIVITFAYKDAASNLEIEVPQENSEVILSNVVEGSRGTVAAGTSVLHPETLEPIMTIGPAEVKLVGVTPDGKLRGILVRSRQITGSNPKIALVDAASVTNLRIEDPCAAVSAELEDTKKALAEANAKLNQIETIVVE